MLDRQDGGEIDQESERAVCKALVVSIVEKVTKAPAKAATDEQFMALCRDVGMQMGLTKVFFQQKAFNSIERLRYYSEVVSQCGKLVFVLLPCFVFSVGA